MLDSIMHGSIASNIDTRKVHFYTFQVSFALWLFKNIQVLFMAVITICKQNQYVKLAVLSHVAFKKTTPAIFYCEQN